MWQIVIGVVTVILVVAGIAWRAGRTPVTKDDPRPMAGMATKDDPAALKARDEEYREGESYTGRGVQSPQLMDNYRSAIRAIGPTTGDIRWEFEMKPRARSGVLATAGEVIFSATVDGYFLVAREETACCRDDGGLEAVGVRRFTTRVREPVARPLVRRAAARDFRWDSSSVS